MCTFFSLLGAIKINFQRIQLVKGVLSSSEHCRTDGWTAGRVEGRRGGGEAREGGKDGEGDIGNEGARKRRKEGERDGRTNERADWCVWENHFKICLFIQSKPGFSELYLFVMMLLFPLSFIRAIF